MPFHQLYVCSGDPNSCPRIYPAGMISTEPSLQVRKIFKLINDISVKFSPKEIKYGEGWDLKAQ